jgi:hypothetical protein
MGVIREKRQVGSIGPIGVVSSRGGDAERYRRLANATDKLTQLAIGEMGRQAQISATEKAQQVDVEKITTINPKTGKPEALDWIGDNRFIGRTGAEAYEKAVAERFQFSIETEIKNKAAEVALKYENDPNAFQAYEREMNTYLDGMLRASEQGGKATSYTNYIADTGVQYVTATKLNMMQEQNRRERAKTASEVLQKNAVRLDLIRQYAKDGKDVSPLLNSVIDSISDLEEGALVDRGSIDEWRKFTAISNAEGVIDREFNKIGRKSAAKIAEAIQIQDTTNLDESELAVYNSITKHMMQETKLDSGETVSVLDFEALAGVATYANQSAAAEENDYQRDRDANRFYNDIEARRFVTDNVNDIDGIIDDFDEFDPETAKENVLGRFASDTEILAQKYEELDFDVTKFNKDRNIIRKSYARKLIIELYDEIEGSPNDREQRINKVIVERKSGDLTGKAKGMADALLAMTGEEHVNMLTEISREFSNVDARNSEKNKAEKTLFQQEVASGYIKNISQSASFVTASELLTEFESKITGYDFLSATQKRTYIDNARDAAAAVFIGKRSTELGIDNSADMAIAAAYAANPNDKEGVPQKIIDMVDRAKTIGSTGFAVESRLVQMTSRLSVRESKDAIRRQKADLNRSIANGLPVKDTDTHREYVEDIIIKEAGDDINYFRSAEITNLRNPATQILYKSIESGVIPESMAQDFIRIANGTSGLSDEEARRLISFYSHFANQPREQGYVDLWLSTNLHKDTRARLEAISLVAQSTSADIAVINQQLAIADDPSVRSSRKEVLGGDIKQFIIRELPEAANNAEAIEMLTPLVKYLYATNQNSGQLSDTINKFYKKSFLPSEGYILDFNHSTGDRSKFSLDAVFRGNEELKVFFVNKVNTEILLAAKETGTKAKTISNSARKDRAFLMPLPQSSGVVMYMLVEQRSGGLHPVINPKTKIPWQWSTAEQDVMKEAERLSVKRFNELPTREEVFDLRNLSGQIPKDVTSSAGAEGVSVPPIVELPKLVGR